MTPRVWVLLGGVSGVWGASFLFIRILLQHGVEPEGVAFGRTALGAASLLPVAALRWWDLPRDGRTWGRLALLATVNFALPWSLVAYAQQQVTSGVAAIGNASMPLWTAVFSTFALRLEPLSGARSLGLALGFGGVILLVGDDLGRGSEVLGGIPVIVTATMLYAASAVAIRRWYADLSPFALTFGQVAFASLFLAPIALSTGAFARAEWDGGALLSLALLGGVGSGVAVLGYMALLREVGPTRASVVTYLIPPTGVLLGWAVLDEPVGPNVVLALLCIATGVALVQGIFERWPWKEGREVLSPPGEPLC